MFSFLPVRISGANLRMLIKNGSCKGTFSAGFRRDMVYCNQLSAAVRLDRADYMAAELVKTKMFFRYRRPLRRRLLRRAYGKLL